MAKARGLGRGLSSLIPERASTPLVDGAATVAGVEQVSVSRISPNPYQPRRQFRDAELAELAESIRLHGVIQPVVVRPWEGDYQLVAGERRVRAAQLIGLKSVPAMVRELTDRDAVELALVENLQRSDLNPMEESHAYRRLLEDFHWTQEEIGMRVGKSRSHIANYLRLLQLDESIQGLIAEQAITVAHAKVLLSVDGERRRVLAERCAVEEWTVKQLEAAVKRGEVPARPRAHEDVHLKSIEGDLRRRFGTKVQLRGDSNKGRIEISYRSLDELERLLAILHHDSPSGPEGFVV
jgi:ParB family chromosome partitioning protein